MNRGVWAVGRARLCSQCHLDMAPEYVFRCDGALRKGICERCGKETMTMSYRYTMNKRGLEKIGRAEG